jgi:hypothetical protein
MSGRTFVDTNVLVYLFDTSSPERARRSPDLPAEVQWTPGAQRQAKRYPLI